MKKIISIILSITMLVTTLCIGFTAYADVLEEKAIENFIDSTCNIIREYDIDNNFDVSEDEDALNLLIYS